MSSVSKYDGNVTISEMKEIMFENAKEEVKRPFEKEEGGGAAEGLRLLLDKLEPDDAALHHACELARRDGLTEGLALLLEKQKKSVPRGFDMDFDL